MTVGPLAIDPAASLYVVVGDEPVDVRLTIRRNHRTEGDRLIIRAFDPDENQTFWQFVKAGQLRDTLGPGDMEVYGIPISIPVLPEPNELVYDATIPLKGKGVHQIRLTAGARNSVATLAFSSVCPYGISFQNGWYTNWNPSLRKAYAYVPPHAQYLCLIGGPVNVTDSSGKAFCTTPNDTTTKVETPITQTETLLTFNLPDDGKFKFRASGFPVILCSTKEAANAIKASVIVLNDGTVVSHKFQERIAALLPDLLKSENVGNADELIKPLAQYKDDYLKDPLRNVHLLNAWSFLMATSEILKNQNVDPTSHWGGSFGGENSWQDRINKPFPENRWDMLGSIKGLYAGTGPRASDGESLAIAYMIDTPGNPYHGKKELLYRAAAASLRDLMTLGEDENWRGVGADNTDYAGMMAFAVAQKTFPVFAHVAPHMPENIRTQWTDGLRHIVDRIYTENLVTCRNQSSHYLVAFESFAQGSGLQRYHELARTYCQRFVNEAHPSGYQIEQCGPDASYIGMTHWHEAVYYQMSKDPVILDGLRKSYGFFNQTVAPEPDGKKVLGGFNFNHRIGDGFYFEQWSGAKGILDDVLPEVGLWSRFKDNGQEAVDKASQEIVKSLSRPANSHHSNIQTMRYLYYSQAPDQSMKLPAEEDKPFIRNHNDELISVKQPGYYAVVYVGHPAPSNHYISSREDYRMPYANDAENKKTPLSYRKVTPYVGGGLSLFWTPEYGSAILGTNWSPVFHQGLVAQQQDQKRYWEDYYKNSFNLDKNKRTLSVDGKIEGQPLSYNRTYTFEREMLKVTVTLTATADVKLLRLFEVLPIPKGSAKPYGVNVDTQSQSTSQDLASTLLITDSRGQGVKVNFDVPQSITYQSEGIVRHSLQMSRAEIQLPATWKTGQTHTLTYTLAPVAK